MPTKWKPAEELGAWGWTAGEWYGGSEDDKGIQTSESSRCVLATPMVVAWWWCGDCSALFLSLSL